MDSTGPFDNNGQSDNTVPIDNTGLIDNPTPLDCVDIQNIISPLSAGFEPAREDPNGFLVHRLNHSATTTL